VPKSINIAGHRFGRIVAISLSRQDQGRHELWHCRCDCGTEKEVYKKSLRNGDTISCGCKKATAKEYVSRIHEAVNVMSSGCWEWKLSRDRAGYGRLKIQLGARDKFRYDSAHRFAYATLVGPIPDNLCVLHRCDNPPCCNPDHLFLGTNKDNMADMIAKGRASWQKRAQQTGEPHERNG
jgi:hypothetical protein